MHLFCNGASNAFVHTKCKNRPFRCGGIDGFVLVEAACPKPRADIVSWVTRPFGPRRHDFFKIPNDGVSLYDLEIQTGAGLFRNLNTRENTGPDIGSFCALTGDLVGINHSSGCGIGMA